MKTTILNFFSFCILLFVSISANAQNAGILDTSFGSGGTVATQLRIAATLLDMEVQSDRKVVVVGSTFDPMGITTVGMVARFNENGTLDTSFDTDGYINTGFMKEVRSVKIMSDGKILVAGYNLTGNGRFSVARLNSNGTFDSSFGGSGIVETSVGFSSSGYSVQILPDNKIIVAGVTQLISGGLKDFAMVKFNSDGSLDTNFGTGGRVASDLFGFDEFANDCVIQPDGKILVAGYYNDPLPNQQVAVIARFNSDGTVDNTFGTNGKVSRIGGVFASANQIALQSDGKIIIVGSGISPVRYNSNGTLDLVFSNPAGNSASVQLQSNGKIIFAGSAAIYRYNQNATLDTTFGNGGIVVTNPSGNVLALAPDGKILLGGTRLNNNFEMTISRYFNNRASAMDFDGDAKTDVSIFRPSNGQWWFSRSSDGGNYALQFGISTDKIVPADYTGDGKTDVAIYRESAGEWYILRSEDLTFYAFPFGVSTDKPVPADYDGDQKADPTVFRPSTATWYILKSSGGLEITPFGAANDRPVPADYDGDGKTDIAIYRQTGGNSPWWIKRSSDQSVYTVITPTAQAPSLPGDYTGDGKADCAYFIGANVGWYVVRSEDNTTYLVQVGLTGDILTPGDYDGDGKLDMGAFRPSDNTWRIRRSSDGGLTQQVFGTSGDYPLPNVGVRQ